MASIQAMIEGEVVTLHPVMVDARTFELSDKLDAIPRTIKDKATDKNIKGQVWWFTARDGTERCVIRKVGTNPTNGGNVDTDGNLILKYEILYVRDDGLDFACPVASSPNNDADGQTIGTLIVRGNRQPENLYLAKGMRFKTREDVCQEMRTVAENEAKAAAAKRAAGPGALAEAVNALVAQSIAQSVAAADRPARAGAR